VLIYKLFESIAMKVILIIILIIISNSILQSLDLSIDILKRSNQINITSNNDVILVFDSDDSTICGNLQILLFDKNLKLIESKFFPSRRITRIKDNILLAEKIWEADYRAFYNHLIKNNQKLGKYQIKYEENEIYGILRNKVFVIDSIKIDFKQMLVHPYVRKTDRISYMKEGGHTKETAIRDFSIFEMESIPLHQFEWYPECNPGEFDVVTKEFLTEFHLVFIPKNQQIVDDYFNSIFNYLRTLKDSK